jgi:hypothetical protein
VAVGEGEGVMVMVWVGTDGVKVNGGIEDGMAVEVVPHAGREETKRKMMQMSSNLLYTLPPVKAGNFQQKTVQVH